MPGTVRVYKDTDGSAPVLTGQVGTLLTVLDAVLVNGYGALTAAGWTKPFANSGNIGCYKNSATDGTGFCLNVNDAGPGAAGAQEARMTGFQTMSALSTGTGQFPTAGQVAIGIGAVVLRKSATANATPRKWTIVADDTVFYMFVESGDWTAPLMTFPFMFGDFFPFGSGDHFNCMIIGRTAENSANCMTVGNANQTQSLLFDSFASLSIINSTSLSNVLTGHYVASNFTGVGTSIAAGKRSDQTVLGSGANPGNIGYQGAWSVGGGASSGQTWPGNFQLPNSPDGGLYCAPIWVHHGGINRGYLKGLWCPLQHHPLNHADSYSGSGNTAGKTLLAQDMVAQATSGNANDIKSPSQVHVETSNTWN